VEAHRVHFGGGSSQYGRQIADCSNSIDLETALTQSGKRLGDAIEPYRQRVIAPGVVENVAAVGGKGEFYTEPAGRIGKDADLVSGGRGEEEKHYTLS
jgi:hypothetical protein